jgi:hypothetical protein
MLEEYTTEEQHTVVFSVGRRTQCRGHFHKEMFPFYGGKFLSFSGSQLGREILSRTLESRRWWHRGAEGAETKVRRLLCCRFRRNVKPISMLVEDMTRNKSFFPCTNIICFTFCIRLWSIYWHFLVRIGILNRLAGDKYYGYTCLAVDGPRQMSDRPSNLKCRPELGCGPASLRVRWNKWVELDWIWAQCSVREEDFLLAPLHASTCRGLSAIFCVSDLRISCPWAFT